MSKNLCANADFHPLNDLYVSFLLLFFWFGSLVVFFASTFIIAQIEISKETIRSSSTCVKGHVQEWITYHNKPIDLGSFWLQEMSCSAESWRAQQKSIKETQDTFKEAAYREQLDAAR